MGRNREAIQGIQQKLDAIETEATRLIVFANNISDAVLRGRLKRLAKIIFRSATAIEVRLKKFGKSRSVARLEQKRRN